MIDGFWIVQFQGLQGNGGGVALFSKGKILGGDSGYTYEGTYEIRDHSIHAKVSVRNYLAGVPNVLGVQGNFDLTLEGTVEGDEIRGKASLVQPAGRPGIVVKLTKRGNLP